MRIILLALLMIASQLGIGQKVYRCDYEETARLDMPDSSRVQMQNGLRDQFLTQGLDSAIAAKFMEELAKQLPLNDLSKKYIREVLAKPDSTLVFVPGGDGGGAFRFNTEEQRLLLTKGRFYQYDFASGEWLPDEQDAPKSFVKSGRTQQILGYNCEEYASTDSSTMVWVTSALPAYINPGIRMGTIPGAILAFEKKGKGPAIRSMIKEIRIN